MVKQWGMILFAFVLFIGVWALAVSKLNSESSAPQEMLSDEVVEREDNLTYQFGRDDSQVIDLQESQYEESEVIEKHEKDNEKVERSIKLDDKWIDLRKYDLSVISTPSGVPIDDLLDLLEIQ